MIILRKTRQLLFGFNFNCLYRLKFSVKWQVLKLTSMFLLFPGRCPSIQLFIHLYTLPLHIVFLSFVRVAIIVVLPPPWKEYKKFSDCFHFKRKQNVYLLFSCPFTFVFWRNFPTIYTFCGRCFWFIRFLCFCFLFFFWYFYSVWMMLLFDVFVSAFFAL